MGYRSGNILAEQTLVEADRGVDFLHDGVDAILTPATPSAAFGIADQEMAADPVKMYLNDIFTVTVNMAGLPGHSMLGYSNEDTGYALQARIVVNTSAVTAACLMSPRAAMLEVGGLSETFPNNYNDIDYCLKLREVGLRNAHEQARLHFARTGHGKAGDARLCKHVGNLAHRFGRRTARKCTGARGARQPRNVDFYRG